MVADHFHFVRRGPVEHLLAGLDGEVGDRVEAELPLRVCKIDARMHDDIDQDDQAVAARHVERHVAGRVPGSVEGANARNDLVAGLQHGDAFLDPGIVLLRAEHERAHLLRHLVDEILGVPEIPLGGA